MKYLSLKKGFTLIELLVVITIIGVLATGAVTVYTSQIQKARDTTRLNDIKALQSAVEQVYQDSFEYPRTTLLFSSIVTYLPSFPKDPKHSKTCAKVTAAAQVYCAYAYNTGTDSNGIAYGSYEVSTAFENAANLTSKAATSVDNGDDDDRLEIGLLTNGAGNISTVTTAGPSSAVIGICTMAGAVPVDGTVAVINGKGTAVNGCG